MPDAAQENAFIEAFVLPQRRDCYRQMLADPRRRHEFLDRLNHNLDFIPALAQPIPGNERSAEGVVRLLCARGMKPGDPVYILSTLRELDGAALPSQQAVEAVLQAEFGSIVCCAAGRLAYYRPEAPASGCILEKPAAPPSKHGQP